MVECLVGSVLQDLVGFGVARVCGFLVVLAIFIFVCEVGLEFGPSFVFAGCFAPVPTRCGHFSRVMHDFITNGCILFSGMRMSPSAANLAQSSFCLKTF